MALPVGSAVIALVPGTLLPVKGQSEYVVVPASAVGPAHAWLAQGGLRGRLVLIP